MQMRLGLLDRRHVVEPGEGPVGTRPGRRSPWPARRRAAQSSASTTTATVPCVACATGDMLRRPRTARRRRHRAAKAAAGRQHRSDRARRQRGNEPVGRVGDRCRRDRPSPDRRLAARARSKWAFRMVTSSQRSGQCGDAAQQRNAALSDCHLPSPSTTSRLHRGAASSPPSSVDSRPCSATGTSTSARNAASGASAARPVGRNGEIRRSKLVSRPGAKFIVGGQLSVLVCRTPAAPAACPEYGPVRGATPARYPCRDRAVTPEAAGRRSVTSVSRKCARRI